MQLPKFFVLLVFVFAPRGVFAEAPKGLLAEWKFDQGKGDIASDSSGNGFDAKLHGATWVKQGNGFAVMLDGNDDYVDCSDTKAFPITGPITFELWVKPLRKAHGMSCLIGEDLSSYLLTYYNTELCQLYIGDGTNSIKTQVNLHEWNHIVTGFDGENLKVWINGRVAGSYESKRKRYKTSGKMILGTIGQPALPKFKGCVDNVRIYSRGLSDDEVLAHFREEAGEHDFDVESFTRVKLTPYYYFDRGLVVVEVDFQNLRPLTGTPQIEPTLSPKAEPEKILAKELVTALPVGGTAEISLRNEKLVAGDYVVRVTLRDGQGERPTEEIVFHFAPKVAVLPSPNETTVPEPPAEAELTPFAARVLQGGGIEIKSNGKTYPFETRVSWPNGDFNVLAAEDAAKGERGFKPRVQRLGATSFKVDAMGEFYSVQRQVDVFPTHVSVKDTYTNTSKEDLGLLVYNQTPVTPEDVQTSLLSGYERWGRQVELPYPDYGPTTLFADAKNGIGIVPLDDVFTVHAVPYVAWENNAGICTEKLAVAAGESYTLEWAIYPTPSRDYYDFINSVRKVEGRVSTVKETPGFISHGPANRRVVPDKDFIQKRGMTVGIIHCLSYAADDPKLHIEGIEFADFPKEMQLLKQLSDDIRTAHPGFKTIFHVAHSLYCTNNPDQFPDSKVILADGTQSTWSDGEGFGEEHQAAGYRWWIFYPTPGNSFHDRLIKSVDVMMDELGYNGAFLDGFLAGYGAMWTYDRWDGHSAEIDLRTKTITRKLGSVVLLSQPSMVEMARKIRDKGGVVVALHTVLTRTICKEDYIIFANECASGPELHLAPNATVLAGSVPIRQERDLYYDMLSKLNWGELFIYYGGMFKFAESPIQAFQYPITFQEIRSGLVRGEDRIITKNSGIYTFTGSRDLHRVHAFDARGAAVRNPFLSTSDARGVRVDVRFKANESAVIEPIPVTIDNAAPVNTRVEKYDSDGLHVSLNGDGEAMLHLRSGALAIQPGSSYRVTVNGAALREVKAQAKTILIPLKLNGEQAVTIEPLK